jgi:hypothetical protein
MEMTKDMIKENYFRYQELREIFFIMLKRINYRLYRERSYKMKLICEEEINEWLKATENVLKKLDIEIGNEKYKEYDNFKSDDKYE